MEVSELQIGDWVTRSFWGGDYFKITSIKGDEVCLSPNLDDTLAVPYSGVTDWIKKEPINKAHKHAEVAKKWFDDPSIEIEYSHPEFESWNLTSNPLWEERLNYRVKPEPKPDIVVHYYSFEPEYMEQIYDGEGLPKNVRFTYDGETKKLKSVEMI